MCGENLTNLMQTFKIESNYERKWIQDKIYVDPDQNSPNSKINRFEAFTDYLKFICNQPKIYWKFLEFVNNEQVS